LTYKAFVPVLLPQQLVLTEIFSSLLVSEHPLFGALVTLDLSSRLNKASIAPVTWFSTLSS
jgi:hypothetical protein